MRGSTWNRSDGSSPERPPMDAQPEAFGYVGQGISEQNPAGVPGARRAYVGAATSGRDRRGEGPWFSASSP